MQAVHACAVHTEHPLDLVVYALLEHHPHSAAIGRKGRHLRRRKRCAVGKGHARRKAGAHLLGQRRVQHHGVGLGDVALWSKDVVGKGAVIGQQHKAGAGLVQPSRREQLPPGIGIPHQIDHGGVALVGGSAHHALGLVEHQVHKLLVIQGFAVHGHRIGFPELGVPFFADSTVHLHPPFGKQCLSLAAGALGRLGQIFIQSHIYLPCLHRPFSRVAFIVS